MAKEPKEIRVKKEVKKWQFQSFLGKQWKRKQTGY